MTKKIPQLLIITCCLINLCGCKSEEIEPAFIVHAAGDEMPYKHYYLAKYWKNGTQHNLSNDYGWANSIFISNNDVYVAGVQNKNDTITVAKYWKNGKGVMMNDNKHLSEAKCIYVKDSTIYTCGYTVVNNEMVGSVWRNGVPEYYYGRTDRTRVRINCVFGSDNKIYFAGGESPDIGENILRYWIDGIGYDLGAGLLATDQINSIYVKNGNVYMVGSMHFNSVQKYDYWINGKPYSLKNGSASISPNALFVSDDDMYIAGNFLTENDMSIAKYWKNGKEVNLTNGEQDAYAQSIFVLGKDVFVGGCINDEPCYWINGKLTKLYYQTKGSINAIFVTREQ